MKVPGSLGVGDEYGPDYFSGVTSGYSTEGYSACHPDWLPWVGLVARLCPNGTWLDLGCAFGYLVRDVAAAGYGAFGLDLSSFALTREPDLRSRLVRGRASSLPFRSGSMDVISCFDILEHLPDPSAALAEAARVLRPEGLLFGATPDPLLFDRFEATHCSEFPPSYWVRILEDLGFVVRFRFGGVPYNFEFLATRPGSPIAQKWSLFRHDGFVDLEDPFQITEGGCLTVPRDGWGPSDGSGRQLTQSPARIYLLNRTKLPQRVRIEFEATPSGGFASLRVRHGSFPVHTIAWNPDSLPCTAVIEDLVIPSGGSHLFFEAQPIAPPVRIRAFRLTQEPATAGELVERTPFDLYQRYAFAAAVIAELGPREVLDVGGLLGDQDGHMAVSRDFWSAARPDAPAVRSVVTDIRPADHPDHIAVTAFRQPFSDGSFGLVVSLDVLEHISPQDRLTYLSELDRLARDYILLGAPFRSPAVEQAEARLSSRLLSARRFLEEHRELGLPDLAEVTRFFEDRHGYRVLALPNGWLPRWEALQVLTQLYFQFGDYAAATGFNTVCNRAFVADDQRSPSYRHLLVIGKKGFAPELASRLSGLRPQPSAGTSDPDSLLTEWVRLHEPLTDWFSERSQWLAEAQFLGNARLRLISELEQGLDHLRRSLDQSRQEQDATRHELERERLEFRKFRETPLLSLALQRLKRRLQPPAPRDR